ncbi:MAG TPA: PaaI family thioesterase [Gammaproteobacteria bacterium]|nr:PaaI family thioesterase [Gammaproteobacteria bacterium]
MSTKTKSNAPRDPDYERRVRASFEGQPAMSRLFGARMVALSPGETEIHIPLRPDFLQQTGNVHGGIVGALADSAAGYAALSLLDAQLEVVTVEYKINFVAPAYGELLIGRGRVVRAGRTLQVCVAEIFAVKDGIETLCAYMTTTMMAVPDSKHKP